jgi:hypothetical protein
LTTATDQDATQFQWLHQTFFSLLLCECGSLFCLDQLPTLTKRGPKVHKQFGMILHAIQLTFSKVESIDSDKNKIIDKIELKNALERNGIPMNEAQLDQLSHALDLNQDGKIQIEEMKEVIASMILDQHDTEHLSSNEVMKNVITFINK